MGAWTITCPTCGHVGDEDDFEMSCADECFCPNGCDWFELSCENEDEDDDHDPDLLFPEDDG